MTAKKSGQDPSAPASEEPGGPTVSVASPRHVGVVKPLKIDTPTVDLPKAEPTKRYWCGTVDPCPFATVHVVVDFPRFHGLLGAAPDGTPIEPTNYGRIHELTDRQVSEIIRRIQQKYIRFVGSKKAELRSIFKSVREPHVKDPRYVPQPKDQPLGKFIYMMEVPEGVMPDRGNCPRVGMME